MNDNKEPSLSLTESAKNRLKELIVENDQPETYFRVWVSGGGCSGLQYGFAIDTNGPEETDLVVEDDGVKIIIDSLSLVYMEGSNIDFVDDMLGGGFKINNPKAKSGCGCGNSFTVEGEEAQSGGCGGCKGCQ